MSSYPSSTCATDGSNKSCPRHIGSASANPQPSPSTSTSTLTINTNTSTINSATPANEQAVRIASYLSNAVDANPSYQNTSSQASMASHSANMGSYLDSFDAAIGNKK
ncbi:hypothetical protein BKA65DRAFT_537413 [Rhexocercosporidium sp. MPI-PUGE-AT-0058]|nr:hypothetical protein BKA65DRAFT_537413 [Rhexocercosporidium sp. MPI-PUGE-AT-0058]